MGQGKRLRIPFKAAEFDLIAAELNGLAEISELLKGGVLGFRIFGLSGHRVSLTRLGSQPIEWLPG